MKIVSDRLPSGYDLFLILFYLIDSIIENRLFFLYLSIKIYEFPEDCIDSNSFLVGSGEIQTR